jgi:flagellar M-ring protein FliF
MSLLNRIRTLPAVGQIVLAAGMALLIAIALGLAWLAMRPKYEVLFRDLRPADAATIVAALEKENIPYRLDDGGAVILAPASRIDETRLTIMGADLPLKGTVGFELFNKSDMGLTEFAQRINYQRALQGELARTIMTIDAVDTARVHLTLPEPSIFRADRRAAEASVTLSTRPGRRLTPEMVTGIQRLVAASVPDLDAGGVVVLSAQGALMTGVEATPAEGLSISASIQRARAVEQYYEAALRGALEPLYPGARVAVLIPADQWASGGDVARDEALARWSPGQRDFRIQVDVSAPDGFSEPQRDDVGRIATAETGWAVERGDALVFSEWTGVSAPVPAAPEAAPAPAEAAPTAARLTPSLRLADFAWVAAGLLILGVATVLLSRRRRPGALTPEERDAYVRRLRRLLAEDAGHVG